MRFRNQVVLITGAARGQGRAHALAFAREGANLVLCDTSRHYASVPYPLSSPQELEKTASEVEALGSRVITEHADVTDLNAMQQLATRAQKELDPYSLLLL
jgi:NAD(P)-dependent dehydrogenase (short-subunit alcohol dehydrogenase family)